MMSTKYVFIIACQYDAEYINLHKKKTLFSRSSKMSWIEKESRQSQFLSVVNNTNKMLLENKICLWSELLLSDISSK